MGAKLLIVDDEPAIRDMVSFQLKPFGFNCRLAANAAEASAQILEQRPDLILLDWMMTHKSGVEFARELRSDPYTRDIPIILLTARDAEGDKVTGFDAGADDYITKPFSSRELLARIKAMLRRSTPDKIDEQIELAGLRIDPARWELYAGSEELNLRPTEFRLLLLFMNHPQQVFSRQQLLDAVWGNDTYIGERTVDVHIRRLRKALSPSGHDRLIKTVRSAGYRFVP
jgi:two-component system phosphate regulon response regulator PhoB